MKRENSLKKNGEFIEVMKYGKKIFTKEIIFYYKESSTIFKLGISISKKIANAVLRNKIKRQIKNILNHFNVFYLKLNIVIIVRQEFLNLSFLSKKNILWNFFKNWIKTSQ